MKTSPPLVGSVVAVGVAEIPDSGVAATNTPPFQTAMPVGQESLLGEDMTLVEDTVAVAIDQQANAADRRVVCLLGVGLVVGRINVGIVGHLDDEEPAVFVVGRGNRARDQRLGGQQIEMEAALDLERSERVRRCARHGTRVTARRARHPAGQSRPARWI